VLHWDMDKRTSHGLRRLRPSQCVLGLALLLVSVSALATGAETDLCPPQFANLWSCGQISIRTGLPLIFEGGEHSLDPQIVSYGYNVVVDAEGHLLCPSGAPLEGGEKLVLTETYQEDHNTRQYALIVSIMAPIRDAILYHFEGTSREEWLELTEVLTLNGIKTQDAPVVDSRAILSTAQVYDYIAAGEAQGSPVARYLEEAELELKCLAFVEFDFTNPEGVDHCAAHDLESGSGIKLPAMP